MEVDMELYKIFYTVAKLGSITKAATELYISQPAVTMSIKKLEEQLEMTLFVRTKRGVILTNEGTILYSYVKEAMECIKIGENKIENLKKLENGNIRIGIGTTLTKHFLIKYLEIFHKKYPNITINIDTSMTSDLLKSLENGKIDIAIISNDTIPKGNFNVVYSENINDIFISNIEYFKKIKQPIKLEELNNYPLLLQNPNSNMQKTLNKFLLKNNITLTPSMELSSYSLVIEFAKIGFGIGFIAKNYVQKELSENLLYEIQTIPKIPTRKILILTKKDYLPNFSTSELINIIKNN